MRAYVLALLAMLGVAAIMATVPAGCGRAEHRQAAHRYHCPMHPTVVDDKPSDCPICGMKLVPIEDDKPAGAEAAKEGQGPSGLAPVSIAADARERMGLKLGTVEKRLLAREIRAAARIVADETRLHHVNVKVDGYVEKLFAATTGQYVKQGEPMLTLYSPALVSAQQEYLNTVKDSPELAASARDRLALWDVTGAQIEALAKAGRPERTVTLHAPASGWILERNIAAGHKVAAGEPLLVLADLSAVWADAELYQSDLSLVKTGMLVSVTVPAVPGGSFTGRVSYIAPVLDPGTRTARVRITVPNDGLALKPEMYGVARLTVELGERPAIQEPAVMFTGERTYAFREAEDGRLVPVEIEVGARAEGWYELLRGLTPGDKVVVSANFLVDSESSMRAAMEALGGK